MALDLFLFTKEMPDPLKLLTILATSVTPHHAKTRQPQATRFDKQRSRKDETTMGRC